MPEFYIVLKNSSGCELDRQKVAPVNEDALSVCVSRVVLEWVINDGDTILIEQVQ